ncbi:MAG: alpha/beta hydrolase, partial [Marinoscillum sp.]
GVEEIELPWYGTLADEISAYIQSNNLKNVIVIGHSMGGMLAIDLAAKYPDRITKMIMVDALPCIREIMMPQFSADQITFDNPYNNQMIAASDSALRVTAGYMAQGMSNTTDKHETLINYIMQSDRQTYVYGYTELLKLDLRDKLASIPAQTLILGADFPSKEAVIPNFEKQFANLKNKDIKIATNSRHFIMFDQPEWFYNEINSFLK